MAAASAPTNEMEGLKLSDSCTPGGSMDSEFHTVVVCGSEPGTTLSCLVGSRSVVARAESGKCTCSPEQDEQFESCKVHWSEPSELAIDPDEKAAAIENREVFKTLQMCSIAPKFFCTFGHDLGVEGRGSLGELEIGEKFAEGGQAEVFHAKVTWSNPALNEIDRKEGNEWALKVFRKGTKLRHLQSQWPEGYLQFRVKMSERYKLGKPPCFRYYCHVGHATLLKDGRFAFLMVKEDGDLRKLINENMRTNVGRHQGPFQRDEEEVAEMIMYRIALGVEWLHNHNIIHRDIKAANVLMTRHRDQGSWMSFVADFECSIGVKGTGFWTAPEVLKALKEKNLCKKPELFTKQADVYSYGMTCYEILTGRFPFDCHPLRDYDLVLDGNRPEVPGYVDD